MNDKTFVDTNILLYAHDRDAGEKHKRAKAILQNLWDSRTGMLSTQVLEEFYVNVTRKISKPLSRQKARDVIRQYLVWENVSIDGTTILEASGVEERFKLSFWDALIIVAAKKGRASLLLSEDLHHGQKFQEMHIRNPFLPDLHSI